MEEEKEKTEQTSGQAPFPDEAELSPAKTLVKGLLPAAKGAGGIVLLNVMFSLLGLLTQYLPDNLLWLNIILYVLFFASMCILTFLIGKNGAYTAVNAATLNEVNAKNGRPVPRYKRMREYRAWKGYAIGAAAALPLVLLCLLSLCFPYNKVISLSSPAYIGVSAVVKTAYSMFYGPFTWFGGTMHAAAALWGVLVNVAAYGLGYFVNGTKIQMQNEQIEEEMRLLHSAEFDVNGSDRIDV